VLTLVLGSVRGQRSNALIQSLVTRLRNTSQSSVSPSYSSTRRVSVLPVSSLPLQSDFARIESSPDRRTHIQDNLGNTGDQWLENTHPLDGGFNYNDGGTHTQRREKTKRIQGQRQRQGQGQGQTSQFGQQQKSHLDHGQRSHLGEFLPRWSERRQMETQDGSHDRHDENVKKSHSPRDGSRRRASPGRKSSRIKNNIHKSTGGNFVRNTYNDYGPNIHSKPTFDDSPLYIDEPWMKPKRFRQRKVPPSHSLLPPQPAPPHRVRLSEPRTKLKTPSHPPLPPDRSMTHDVKHQQFFPSHNSFENIEDQIVNEDGDNTGFFQDVQGNFPEIEDFGIESFDSWESQKIRKRRSVPPNPERWRRIMGRHSMGRQTSATQQVRRQGPAGFWDDADFDAEFFAGGGPPAYNSFESFTQRNRFQANPQHDPPSRPHRRPYISAKKFETKSKYDGRGQFSLNYQSDIPKSQELSKYNESPKYPEAYKYQEPAQYHELTQYQDSRKYSEQPKYPETPKYHHKSVRYPRPVQQYQPDIRHQYQEPSHSQERLHSQRQHLLVEDNSILGSGNFDILKGGTFYSKNDYPRSPYSPAYRPQGDTDIFHNFRDFADIKSEARPAERYRHYH